MLCYGQNDIKTGKKKNPLMLSIYLVQILPMQKNINTVVKIHQVVHLYTGITINPETKISLYQIELIRSNTNTILLNFLKAINFH